MQQKSGDNVTLHLQLTAKMGKTYKQMHESNQDKITEFRGFLAFMDGHCRLLRTRGFVSFFLSWDFSAQNSYYSDIEDV